MSLHPAEVRLNVRHRVRPELADPVGVEQAQDLCSDAGALADAHQEADERTFEDRAQGHAIDAAYLRGSWQMILLLLHREGDEHVGVEQVGRHSSLSAAAT